MMGPFQTDPVPMLDPTFSLQAGLLDVTNPDMTVFDPALSLDLASMPPATFDQMDAVQSNSMSDVPSKSDTPDSNIPANGVGAGPLPTDFAAQSGNHSSSTLTEFTKRRNWSQR